MDDNTKIVNQNVPLVAPADQTVSADQVQPQAVPQPVTPSEPSAPVGSVNKEAGPVSAPVSDFIKPSETQPQIDRDIAELGVEAKKDEPNLTPEHKELGVDHAGPHVPAPSSPTGKVTMPMSEEEIAEKLKTGQDDDSGKWLAGLIQKIIKVLGF